MESAKYTYRLNYRYENQQGRVIEFARYEPSQQLWMWLDKRGGLHEVAELTDNDQKNILRWSAAQVENIGPNKSRCFLERSYVSVEDEDRIPDKEDRITNLINRVGHDFLKKHPSVIVRDHKGENINKYTTGGATWELVEKSALELKEVEKNKKLAEGTRIITELYEKSTDQFLEFCYAYNITVKDKTLEQIYNACMTKVNFNPFGWETVLKDSNYNLISKFRKGLEDGIIELENGYYKFNYETIGQTDDECISYFTLNESPRNLLYSKVGFATPTQKLSPKVEVNSGDLGDQIPTMADKKTINTKIYRAIKLTDEAAKKQALINIKEEHKNFTAYVEEKILELSK